MTDYKVPKERAKVLLFIPPDSPQEGSLYLSPNAAGHLGKEMVSDILRGLSQFCPVLGEWDELVLVRKDAIRYIMVIEPEKVEWKYFEEMAGAPALRISFSFFDDERMEGTIYATGPEGERRVLDVINSQEGFLPVETGDGFFLVNLKQVKSVRILEDHDD